MKIRTMFLGLCALCSFALSAENLSFKAAYERALENNDALKAAQSSTQKQEKLKTASRLIYLPQVSLNALYVRLQEPMQLQMFHASQLPNLPGVPPNLTNALTQPITLQDQNIILGAVNIIYPLFTGGKRYFANRLSDLALEDSRLALKLKELGLFEDCAKLYYGVVLSQQILQTLESAKLGHYEHYQNAKKLQEKGQIARLEALQAQVNYDRAVIDVQKARDNLKIANLALESMLGEVPDSEMLSKTLEVESEPLGQGASGGADKIQGSVRGVEELERLMGLGSDKEQAGVDSERGSQKGSESGTSESKLSESGTPSAKFTLAQSIQPQTNAMLQNAQHFISRTLEVYPALHIADNKIKAANELSHIEFSAFLPEVALFGNYLVSDNSSILDKTLPSWYVGVGAKWNLITPQGRLHKYQASKIAQIEAQYAYAQAKKDLQTLCEKTYYEVLSYRQQYVSLSSSIELARENLKLRERAFLQGLSTSSEVSDARNALSMAMIERQSVAYNYTISLSRLLALSDEIGEFYRFVR